MKEKFKKVLAADNFFQRNRTCWKIFQA